MQIIKKYKTQQIPAKDLYHEQVRNALINDGWTVTHDPYRIAIENWQPDYQVDFGAERTCLAAEKGTEKIAVEVKNFIAHSFAYEFHKAIGQYLTYAVGIRVLEPKRVLYLALSKTAYKKNQISELQKLVVNTYDIKLLVFDIDTEKITLWKK